jgi:hypothetical protein
MNWIKKIHMYAGLFNFTILCLFGLAGLVVTAEAPDIFHGDNKPPVSTLPFTAPPSASDKEVAALIISQYRPPKSATPNPRRNAQHQLVMDFYSVNGLVRMTLLESSNQLQVETYRNSIWRFFDNAHATTLQEQHQDWPVRAWAWYIEISIWSLLLMALTGTWLGLTSRWNFWWTKASFAAGTVAFAVFYMVQK